MGAFEDGVIGALVAQRVMKNRNEPKSKFVPKWTQTRTALSTEKGYEDKSAKMVAKGWILISVERLEKNWHRGRVMIKSQWGMSPEKLLSTQQGRKYVAP